MRELWVSVVFVVVVVVVVVVAAAAAAAVVKDLGLVDKELHVL